jgi:hypothetical protein
MNDEEDKSKSNIHIGGIILMIVLIIVLIKVDIKSEINSPQFKSNVTYIKQQTKNIWDQYLSKPIMYAWDNLFNNLINQGIKQIKENQPNLNSLNNTNTQQPTQTPLAF